MRLSIPIVVLLFSLFFSLALHSTPSADADSLGTELRRLAHYYGNYIEPIDEDNPLWITLKNGEQILWDDGVSRTADQALTAPSLKDQFSCDMIPTAPLIPPAPGHDPGRARVESFFHGVYGNSEAEVRRNLRPVSWPSTNGSTTVLFNRNAGAAEALERVATRIRQNPALYPGWLRKAPGTFHYRRIAGTDRLSAHSYGIALDLRWDKVDYWRWRGLKQPIVWRNRIPAAVVHLFESYGFIWGGRWHHYDTMHFEYRPECFKPKQ